jgi:hypothetical protein
MATVDVETSVKLLYERHDRPRAGALLLDHADAGAGDAISVLGRGRSCTHD